MDPASCGPGLAENAALPRTLGEVMAAMAGVLSSHLASLVPGDAGADQERTAYETLVAEQRAAAAQLQAVARRMAGYRDLPPALHDDQTLSSPEAMTAFARFLQAKQELLALLQSSADEERQMLAEMRP